MDVLGIRGCKHGMVHKPGDDKIHQIILGHEEPPVPLAKDRMGQIAPLPLPRALRQDPVRRGCLGMDGQTVGHSRFPSQSQVDCDVVPGARRFRQRRRPWGRFNRPGTPVALQVAFMPVFLNNRGCSSKQWHGRRSRPWVLLFLRLGLCQGIRKFH